MTKRFCSVVSAPIASIDFYTTGRVSVFFGPVCDYSLAPVARYASHWGIPVISSGGMAHDYAVNKTSSNGEYKLLTRMGIASNQIAHFVHSILTHFKIIRVKVSTRTKVSRLYWNCIGYFWLFFAQYPLLIIRGLLSIASAIFLYWSSCNRYKCVHLALMMMFWNFVSIWIVRRFIKWLCF